MGLDALSSRISRLLKEGSIASSQLSRQSRKVLAPLFDAGVLVEERSGAGKRVRVISKKALLEFGRKIYPSGFDGEGLRQDGIHGLSKTLSLGFFRDAKRSSATSPQPVLLRGTEGTFLSSQRGRFPVGELTSAFGLSAIILKENETWGFEGSVALVENLEPFLAVEKTGVGAELSIYAGGVVSNRILDWLCSPEMAGCPLYFLPDYDPEGLEEYLRVRERVGRRATLFVPDGIAALFKKYGKPSLLSNQRAAFQRLRKRGDRQIRDILDLMEEYGAGLEQEALVLQPKDLC